MKANTTMHADSGEVSGTKFFTWAILVVTAGLLVALTTDFMPKQTAPVAAAQTTTSQNAS